MGVHWGANLVGMSCFFLMPVHSPGLPKRKKQNNVRDYGVMNEASINERKLVKTRH